MADDFDLQRFVDAQDPVFSRVVDELMAGRKNSHWMWFVFPQMKGLGHSPTAERYGIASLKEAQAYYEHAVLGPRLLQCTDLVMQIRDKSARAVFGSPDDMKFRSSMTLFQAVAPTEPAFQAALSRFFEGQPDARTLQLLTA